MNDINCKDTSDHPNQNVNLSPAYLPTLNSKFNSFFCIRIFLRTLILLLTQTGELHLNEMFKPSNFSQLCALKRLVILQNNWEGASVLALAFTKSFHNPVNELSTPQR